MHSVCQEQFCVIVNNHPSRISLPGWEMQNTKRWDSRNANIIEKFPLVLRDHFERSFPSNSFVKFSRRSLSFKGKARLRNTSSQSYCLSFYALSLIVLIMRCICLFATFCGFERLFSLFSDRNIVSLFVCHSLESSSSSFLLCSRLLFSVVGNLIRFHWIWMESVLPSDLHACCLCHVHCVDLWFPMPPTFPRQEWENIFHILIISEEDYSLRSVFGHDVWSRDSRTAAQFNRFTSVESQFSLVAVKVNNFTKGNSISSLVLCVISAFSFLCKLTKLLSDNKNHHHFDSFPSHREESVLRILSNWLPHILSPVASSSSDVGSLRGQFERLDVLLHSMIKERCCLSFSSIVVDAVEQNRRSYRRRPTDCGFPASLVQIMNFYSLSILFPTTFYAATASDREEQNFTHKYCRDSWIQWEKENTTEGLSFT